MPVAAPAAEGAPAAPPPVPTTTTTNPAATPRRHAPWWVVPLVIVGLVLIAFLVLMGLPFGGRDKDRPSSTAAKTETIAEAEPAPAAAPVQTATLIDVTEEPPPEVLGTMEPDAPVQSAPPVRSRPRVVTQPAPARTVPAPATQPPASSPDPIPERRVETPPPAQETSEITVSEAMSSVRAFVTSRDYYGVGADCVGVGSLGYQNVGYTIEVRDTCNQRTLGRWRVDAKTREIFRQREDGRYLRP